MATQCQRQTAHFQSLACTPQISGLEPLPVNTPHTSLGLGHSQFLYRLYISRRPLPVSAHFTRLRAWTTPSFCTFHTSLGLGHSQFLHISHVFGPGPLPVSAHFTRLRAWTAPSFCTFHTSSGLGHSQSLHNDFNCVSVQITKEAGTVELTSVSTPMEPKGLR